MGSRYCETDLLSEDAWRLFGYEHARPTRTAAEAYAERRGVCRDFAHLATALTSRRAIAPAT